MTILHLILLLVVATATAIAQTQTDLEITNLDIDIDCDPCIDRSQYRIRAIVHGRQHDPFWQDVKASMTQTSRNMGVDFSMILYDRDDIDISRQMATDIRNTVVLESPHALIVSLPGDSLVERALESVQDRVPIFVVNAMVPFPLNSGGGNVRISNERFPAFHSATYMNETDAAAMIAYQIEDLVKDLEFIVDDEDDRLAGVFISHEPGIPLLTHRYNLLSEATNDVVDWDMIELNDSTDDYQVELTSLFDGCNYTVVQLAGASTVEATMNALVDNGCDQDTMIVGTYDSSPLVIDTIDAGSVNFAISQQPQFQGSMSVLLASMYATTGQTLTSSGDGVRPVFSGPTLITADNLPFEDTNKFRDKSKLNIKVLTHDLATDPFWETVYAGLQQAASDFDVNLVTHRFKSAVTGRGEVSLERSFSVREACRTADIDGLIVSLPHDGMVDALSVCYSREIPVIAINAAPDDAITPDLPYVGQQDYQSGFEAGKVLIDNGVISGSCLVHADLPSLKERCRGMEAVFAESEEAEYKGIIQVFTRDESEYKNIVEMAFGSGDWSEIGVLSTGQIQIPALLALLQDHPELKAGTFDMDTSVFGGNDKLLFSIDQQPYVQGYLSLGMMQWRIDYQQPLTNTRFDTGPKFVFSAPSTKRKRCQENGFAVCKANPPLKHSGKCEELGRPCEVCEGDCGNDSHCAEGLVCFVRDSKTLGAYQDVPGCSTNPVELNAKDFCVDDSLYACSDEEPFRLRPSDGQGYETCDFVANDLSRCTMYGIYCRETCGYCRPRTP